MAQSNQQGVLTGGSPKPIQPESALYAAAGFQPDGLIADQDAHLLVANDDPAAWCGYWAVGETTAWKATKVQAWTRWTHRVHTGCTVWVYLPSLVTGRDQRIPFLEHSADVAEQCLALYDMARLTGHPWSLTAGHTAHLAIQRFVSPDRDNKGVRPDRRIVPYWNQGGTTQAPNHVGGDMIWRRRPTKAEAAGYVHAFDMNAARLASMGNAEVGAGRLERRGPIAFDPALGGWWKVERTDLTVRAQVQPHRDCPPLVDLAPDMWVTTPVMRYWMDGGIQPPVVDSWVSPARRLFRTTAQRWNDARLITEGVRLDAVKAMYRAGCGLLASPGGLIYRPDWYHTIMDQQRVTLYRRIQAIYARTGLWPIRVQTDCVWYATDTEDAAMFAGQAGIRIDPKALGAWKIYESRPASEVFRSKERAS